MYRITQHGTMIADHARTDAYVEALRRATKAGAVVVDIGTGTGIFAVLACRFGARKVYGIEAADVIDLARHIAADNGCADRIEFIHGVSTEVNLPERADVVIADLHGQLPQHEGNIVSLIDARERFLAAGGTMIPRADRVWMVPVETPELYGLFANPWLANRYDLDMQAGAPVATSEARSGRVNPAQMLAPPQRWATLDFMTITDPNASARLAWSSERPGTCHGFAAWFDSTLSDGIEISNGPGSAAYSYSYSNVFFPWTRPVDIAPGDRIEISCAARLIGRDYVWTWDSRVVAGDASARVKCDFRQSTFFAGAAAASSVRKIAASHVPTLSDTGRIDREILELMDGTATLADIARRIADRYPSHFTRWQDALARASELSVHYSR